MADIGNSTVFIGSPDWYIGDPETYPAVVDYVDPRAAQYGLNSTVRFIANGAYSPDPIGDPLFFEWRIQSRPPKSISNLVPNQEEARLEVDSIGIYVIELYVFGANGGASQEVLSVIVGQPASVAYNGGLEYDVSWIWRTLSDFWSVLGRKDLLRIEAVWQGLQSLVSADLIDVFNAKDSISINTIQASIFRKWASFDLTVDASVGQVLYGAKTSYITRLSDSEIKIGIANQQQRYDALLLKNNTLLVPGIIPQSFDTGRPARVTNVKTGYLSDVKIVGIGKTSSGTSTFTIPPQNVAAAELPLEYDFRLYTPSYLSRVIVSLDGEYLLSSGGGSGYLKVNLEGPLPNKASIPIQLKLENAEILGVSVGDVILVTLQDDVSRDTLEIDVNVVAVFGDLVAVELTDTIQTYLNTAYSDDVASILLEDINSVGWQARHRGAWCGINTLYQIGVGGIYKKHVSIRQATLYRRSRILIDRDVRALFRLTSNVTRLIQSDTTLLSSAENVVTTNPIELYENTDFYIRPTSDIGYRLRTVTLNEFKADGYNFSLARVQIGSSLVVTTGLGTGTYVITDIVDESVYVSPPAPISFTDATFYVKSDNAYLELHSQNIYGDFVAKLWAEYAVYDNSDRIENVFGSSVGLSRDLWESLNNKNTYRDAVASIIKTRVTATTVDAIDNVVSLSLGIPLAPYKSIIRDIDYSYRFDAEGNPTEYHVTLEEITPTGALTGRLSTHDVSASSDLRLSSTSGMAINPSTGTKYVAGDEIEQYASIGEGVRIIDLYTTDFTFALNDIIDRHRFAVLIDVDSVDGLGANPEKLSLMRSLIFEAKPSYTTFFIRLLKYLVDYINIEDDVFIKLRTRFYDNPYHHRGPANIYDDNIPGRSDRDAAPMLPLTTWFPRDGQIFDTDLVTGTFVLVSNTGGFVTPTSNTGSGRFNPTGIYPWIEAGDYVEFVSATDVKLQIKEVINDTKLLVSLADPADITQMYLRVNDIASASNIRFFVYRLLTDYVSRADITIPLEGNRVDIQILGQSSTNFGVGDVLTISTNDVQTNRLRILHTTVDPVTNLQSVFTYPNPRGLPNSSNGDIRIFRELIKDRVLTGSVKARAASSPYVDVEMSAFALGLDVGDIIDVDGVIQSKIVGIRENKVFTEVLLPPILQELNYSVYRQDTNIGADDLDEQELAVGSSVQVILHKVALQFIEDGVVIDRNGIIRPGDIILTNERLDLGEGDGVIRVTSNARGNMYYTNLFGLPQSLLTGLTGKFTCSLIRQDKLHSDYFFTNLSQTIETWGNVRTRP